MKLKFSPVPVTVTALLSLLVLTGCQGAAEGEATESQATVPNNSTDTVSEWWQALRDGNVSRAAELQSKPLTDEYYTEDRLKSLSNGIRNIDNCEISFGKLQAVDGGEIVMADLTKCKFNKVTHWTWKVDADNGHLVQSDTGDSVKAATDRFAPKK